MQLTDEELKALLKDAAKEGVKEYKREEEKAARKNPYHDTYKLMKCYRAACFHIENAISDGNQLELDDMTDEQQETYIRSIRRTRFRTLLYTAHIDKCIDEIKRKYVEEGKPEMYKAFELYFMDGLGYEQIAEELNCSTATPRRWVNQIISELSVLLYGLSDF